MSTLRARREADGTLVVEGITPLVTAVIRELPGLLAEEPTDAVKSRLFPDPSDDETLAAEWRIRQHPELFALLADARRIVEADLPALQKHGRGAAHRLTIPADHVTAWISALNAARLALGARHDITAEEMQADFAPTADDRGLALLRIDLYGWLQGTMIEAISS